MTEEDMRGVMLGVTVALRDLHRVLIDAKLQTADEAIDRLELNIAELAGGNPPATATVFLRGLQLALHLPATGLADLAGQAPEGQAD